MELRDQRICITGGAGFVGSHLADRLVRQNDITVVDDFSNGRREWVPEEATCIAGDLRDPAILKEAIDEGTTLVFHCAADKAVNTDDPNEQFRSNTELTATVLKRMQAVGCDRDRLYLVLDGVRRSATANAGGLRTVGTDQHVRRSETRRGITTVGVRPQSRYASVDIPFREYRRSTTAAGAVIPDFIQNCARIPRN